MNDKFEIDGDMLDTEPEEIIDEKMTEAARRAQEAVERMVAMAFHDGYDGVDIHYESEIEWHDSMPLAPIPLRLPRALARKGSAAAGIGWCSEG